MTRDETVAALRAKVNEELATVEALRARVERLEQAIAELSSAAVQAEPGDFPGQQDPQAWR